MELINLKEIKAAKNGEVTPKALVENVTSNIGRVKDIVMVLVLEDDEVQCVHTSLDRTRGIGLLEFGKMEIYNDMSEGE